MAASWLGLVETDGSGVRVPSLPYGGAAQVVESGSGFMLEDPKSNVRRYLRELGLALRGQAPQARMSAAHQISRGSHAAA